MHGLVNAPEELTASKLRADDSLSEGVARCVDIVRGHVCIKPEATKNRIREGVDDRGMPAAAAAESLTQSLRRGTSEPALTLGAGSVSVSYPIAFAAPIAPSDSPTLRYEDSEDQKYAQALVTDYNDIPVRRVPDCLSLSSLFPIRLALPRGLLASP